MKPFWTVVHFCIWCQDICVVTHPVIINAGKRSLFRLFPSSLRAHTTSLLWQPAASHMSTQRRAQANTLCTVNTWISLITVTLMPSFSWRPVEGWSCCCKSSPDGDLCTFLYITIRNNWLDSDQRRSFTISVTVPGKQLTTCRKPSGEGCQKQSCKHACVTGRVFLTPPAWHSCWWWPGIPPEAQPTNNKQHGSWHRKTPARLSDTAGLFPGPGRAAGWRWGPAVSGVGCTQARFCDPSYLIFFFLLLSKLWVDLRIFLYAS